MKPTVFWDIFHDVEQLFDTDLTKRSCILHDVIEIRPWRSISIHFCTDSSSVLWYLRNFRSFNFNDATSSLKFEVRENSSFSSTAARRKIVELSLKTVEKLPRLEGKRRWAAKHVEVVKYENTSKWKARLTIQINIAKYPFEAVYPRHLWIQFWNGPIESRPVLVMVNKLTNIAAIAPFAAKETEHPNGCT